MLRARSSGSRWSLTAAGSLPPPEAGPQPLARAPPSTEMAGSLAVWLRRFALYTLWLGCGPLPALSLTLSLLPSWTTCHSMHRRHHTRRGLQPVARRAAGDSIL